MGNFAIFLSHRFYVKSSFCDSKVSKSAIFKVLAPLKYGFRESLHFIIAKVELTKNQNIFSASEIVKIVFTQNLSGRKIAKSHIAARVKGFFFVKSLTNFPSGFDFPEIFSLKSLSNTRSFSIFIVHTTEI